MSKDGMSKDSCYARDTESGCNSISLFYISFPSILENLGSTEISL